MNKNFENNFLIVYSSKLFSVIKNKKILKILSSAIIGISVISCANNNSKLVSEEI